MDPGASNKTTIATKRWEGKEEQGIEDGARGVDEEPKRGERMSRVLREGNMRNRESRWDGRRR